MKALAGILVALFAAEVALACTCFAPGEPQAELAQADAVFAGTPRTIRFVPDTVRVDGRQWISGHIEVEFRVLASWKGIRPDKVVLVTTARDGGFCGFRFKLKKSHIVYARFDSVRRVFRTSSCDRTCYGPEAYREWDALGPPKWSSSGLWGKWKL